MALTQQDNGILSRNLPSRLLLVESLSILSLDTNNDIRLDCSDGTDWGSSWFGSEGSDRYFEWGGRGCVTVVGELGK